MKRRSIMILLALCGALPLLAPAGAGAATGTIDVCASEGSNPIWAQTVSDYWQIQQFCPGRIELGGKPLDTLYHGFFAVYPDGASPVPFTRVRFRLSGGDGSDGSALHEMAVCSSSLTVCGPSIRPAGPDISIPVDVDLSSANGDFPVGANRLRLQAKCLAGPCTPSRPMAIDGLLVDFEDGIPPTIEWDWDRLDEPGIPGLTRDGWNNATRRVPVRAADGESGVDRVIYRVGPVTAAIKGNGCGDPELPNVTNLCPNLYGVWDEVFAMPLYFHGLDQGATYPLSITAYDAAGNASAPLSTTVRLDVYRPMIRDLTVTSATGGWQSSTTASLAWSNYPEDEPSATRSGVEKVVYDVQSQEPGGVDPDAVEVVATGVETLSGIQLPGPGSWTIRVNTVDFAGNASEVNLVTVRVDSAVAPAPSIKPVAPVGLPALLSGATVEWDAPAAPPISGICGYASSFDRHPHSDPGIVLDHAGDATAAIIPDTLSGGTRYFHLRAVSCSGVPGEIADMPLEIDVDPPRVDLSPAPAGGWHSADRPLIASIDPFGPATDELSVSVDGLVAPWTTEKSTAVALTDGEHEVEAFGRDALGNVSTTRATVRYDGSPPIGSIDPIDPRRPTRVSATVGDPHSGVWSAQLQFRSTGGGEWRNFGSSMQAGARAEPVVTVEGRFPDDELADGAYAVRVVAFDQAGHRAEIGLRSDGAPAVLTLPLRRAATVEFGFERHAKKVCRRVDGKRRCTMRSASPGLLRQAVFAFGETARMSGRLYDASGEPIGGAEITVRESVLGARGGNVAATVTDSSGRFTYRPRPGASRAVIARFGGGETTAAGEGTAKFLGRPKVVLKVSGARVGRRGTITFSGRVHAPGAVFPPSGKGMRIEYAVRGRWRMLPLRLRAAADGRFRVEWTPPRSARPIRWVLRAVVPWDDGWAYEDGHSRARTVVVG